MVEVYYPVAGDVIPFDTLPLITKYSPYSTDYKRYNWTFDMHSETTTANSFSDHMIWAQASPRLSQIKVLNETCGAQLPDFDESNFPEERAQLLANNKPPESKIFQRGETYTWEVEIALRSKSGLDDLTGSTQSSAFKVGMAKSQLQIPAHNDTIRADSIDFRWLSAPAPTKLLPDYYVYQAGNDPSYCNFFSAQAHERWRMEISGEADFSEILFSRSNSVGSASDPQYNFENLFEKPFGGQDAGAITTFKNEFYKELEATEYITPGDSGLFVPGDYYWRVVWLEDPTDTDSDFYEESEIRRFIISEKEENQTDSIPKGDCHKGCVLDIANVTGIDTTFAVGGIFKIGNFSTVISEITQTGFQLSGKGLVLVPFLNAWIKVGYDKIVVNDSLQAISGHALALQDDFKYTLSEINTTAGKVLQFADTSLHKEINRYLTDGGRLAKALTGEEELGMPVGLSTEISGREFIAAIVEMKFNPTHATLGAISVVEIDEDEDFVLSFGIKDACIVEEGLADSITYYLPRDLSLEVAGSPVPLTFYGPKAGRDNGCYLTMSCDGFKELEISGEGRFPRSWMVPENSAGEIIDGDERVKALFHMRINKDKFEGEAIKGLLAKVSVTPFQIDGWEGYGFEVDSAYLDLSRLENAPGMKFPSGFADTMLLSQGEPAEWKGFYLQNLKVRLPEDLLGSAQSNPLQILGQNFIIDTYESFTGEILATNITSVDTAQIGGFPISLDTVKLTWIDTKLPIEASVLGRIQVPLSDDGFRMKYRGLLNRRAPEGGDSFFEFIARTDRDTETIDLFPATLALAEDTQVRVYAETDSLHVLATLNGKITIDSTNQTLSQALGQFSLSGFEFSQMQVGTDIGFDPGTWSRVSPQKKIAGFDASIGDFSFESTFEGQRQKVGLKFNVNIEIAERIAAESRIGIYGYLNMPINQAFSAEFAGVEMDSMAVEGDFGIVDFSGSIALFNDHPTYGDGFAGNLAANFNLGDLPASMSASAFFGKKSDFNYWYVDGFVGFPTPVPLFAGITMHGFGGGVYRHMSPAGNPTIPGGSSNSGLAYVPNNSISLGIKASTRLAVVNEEAFNADVGIEANFQGFTINMLSLAGDAYFMTSIAEREKKVFGDIDFSYDFPNKIFHGNIDAYVKVADDWIIGDGNVSGKEENFAGNGTIHVDSEKWHFLLGTPASPIQLAFKDLATAGGYFMVGQDLPLGGNAPGALSTIDEGNGFAMGADLSFDTGKKTFLIFYGDFAARLGIDIAVLKTNMACSNSSGSLIGVNGWYATGQLDVELEGSIGIKVKLWKTIEQEILKVSGSIGLQAGLPNPSYFTGYFSGEYEILGGLVSGQCNFKIDLGERCDPVDGNPLALNVIGDVTPREGTNNVSIFTQPAATFNIAVDKPFSFIRDGDDEPGTFKAIVSGFSLKENGTLRQTNIVYGAGENKTIAYLDIPGGYLKEGARCELTIKVKFQERIGGTFADLSGDNGTYYETKTVQFTVGPEPDHLVTQDIKFIYPLEGQRFLMPGETARGGITMWNPRPKVFAAPKPSTGTVFGGFLATRSLTRFVRPSRLPQLMAPLQRSTANLNFLAVFEEQGSGAIHEVPCQVNGDQFVSFEMPPLNLDSRYDFRLIGRHPSTRPSEGDPTSVDRLLRDTTVDVLLASRATTSNSSTALRTTRSMTGVFANVPDKVLYEYRFETSEHSTLASKLSALGNGLNDLYASAGYEEIRKKTTGSEGFDTYELDGHTWSLGSTETHAMQPLLQFEALPNIATNDLMQEVYWPHEELASEYTGAPVLSLEHFGKTVGIPPVEACVINPLYKPRSPLANVTPPTPGGSGGAMATGPTMAYASTAFVSATVSYWPTYDASLRLDWKVSRVAKRHYDQIYDMVVRWDPKNAPPGTPPTIFYPGRSKLGPYPKLRRLGYQVKGWYNLGEYDLGNEQTPSIVNMQF